MSSGAMRALLFVLLIVQVMRMLAAESLFEEVDLDTCVATPRASACVMQTFIRKMAFHTEKIIIAHWTFRFSKFKAINSLLD